MARLQKESILLNYPTGWLTPGITAIGKGLKNAHGLGFKFQHFIDSRTLIKLLNHVQLGSLIGQAYFLSYLFSLMVPSDTVRWGRGFSDGRITEFPPKKEKELIATRTHKWTTFLVVKFLFREIPETDAFLRYHAFALKVHWPQTSFPPYTWSGPALGTGEKRGAPCSLIRPPTHSIDN